MDSLENEEPQETRINPSEPEMDLSEAEGFPLSEQPGEDQGVRDRREEAERARLRNQPVIAFYTQPIEEPPPFVHTFETIYWYDDEEGKGPTKHTVLGIIEPGENRFPTDEPVMVAALEARCDDGLLRQITTGSEPAADDEMPQDEKA